MIAIEESANGKEVKIVDRRYIVCRNELEANKDADDRAAILEGLEQQLKRGDKAWIGNSAYRRFLKAGGEKVFQIDPGKVADEARFDGIFVLRTAPLGSVEPVQQSVSAATAGVVVQRAPPKNRARGSVNALSFVRPFLLRKEKTTQLPCPLLWDSERCAGGWYVLNRCLGRA